MGVANKVILNTAILYGRMLLTMGVSLYSTRLVLNALGSTDYGIFNLVAGVIAMLAFLNTAMATSTQRYLSFHQGKNEPNLLKKIFTNSLILHLLIGSIIVIGLEIGSFFLFNGFLNIPEARIGSAKIIYHFMVCSIFFSVTAVPFFASLYAHENMIWIAVVYIIEALLKLGMALLLLKTHADKLVLYGFLTAVISFLVLVLHMVYCLKKYEECTLFKFWIVDKSLIKELTSFAGWNLFGSLCSLGRIEGLTILLNLFFGTVINAAYGIATQIAGQLGFFSATMLQALNPQIMKSEGANDRQRMLRLSMVASKFGFFLFAFISIPCIFEMPSILSFWLKNVPTNTVLFCQLSLVGSLINQLTIGLQTAIQATGKIKSYQIVIGSIVLTTIPLGFFLLQFGYPAYSVLIGYICLEGIACCCRLYFLKRVAGLSIKEFISRVFKKEIFPICFSIVTCMIIIKYVEMDFRFLLTGIASTIVFIISIYFTGLCEDEKNMIKGIIFKSINRLRKINILSKIEY